MYYFANLIEQRDIWNVAIQLFMTLQDQNYFHIYQQMAYGSNFERLKISGLHFCIRNTSIQKEKQDNGFSLSKYK